VWSHDLLKACNYQQGKRKENPSENWQIVQNTHPEHRLLTDEEAAEIHQIIEFNAKLGPPDSTNNPSSPESYGQFTYQTGLVFVLSVVPSACPSMAIVPPDITILPVDTLEEAVGTEIGK
jgi:hypothetical protein